jgi:SAM-dependent methyltransferase
VSILSKALSAASLRVRGVEDWWFDRTRHVDTRPDRGLHRAVDVVGSLRDGYLYLPVRARNLRSALRALPIDRPAEYTFIDLGSGKGKSVFVAAELPFKRVVGVEYSAALDEQAQANAQSFRRPANGSACIEMVHADAAEYVFPAGKLVVYFFNPFGPEVMGCVLRNLEQSLRESPRHVVVLLLWPEQAVMVAAMPAMRLCAKTRRYEVYEACRMAAARTRGMDER